MGIQDGFIVVYIGMFKGFIEISTQKQRKLLLIVRLYGRYVSANQLLAYKGKSHGIREFHDFLRCTIFTNEYFQYSLSPCE